MVVVLFALLFAVVVFLGTYLVSTLSRKKHIEDNSAPDTSLRILTSADGVEPAEVKELLRELRKSFGGMSKAKRDAAYADFYSRCGVLVARYIGYKVEMDEYDDLIALLPIMKKAKEENMQKDA